MSHSLVLPRHVGEARQRALKDPGVEVNPRVEGKLARSDDWFEGQKALIRQQCGWALDKTRITLNRVLVAVFIRPDTHEIEGGGSIIMPDTVVKEDIYQGNSGLVLKLGPRCFEDSEIMTWTDDDKFAVGDWVLLRRGDGGGFRLRLNGVECIMFENEKGIKAVVPRPDVVY